MSFKYTQLQRAWLDDLKKTRAKQTIGFLHDKYGWCCLGRLCHVAGAEVVRTDSFGLRYFGNFDVHSELLPEEIYKRVHLRGRSGLAKEKYTIDGRDFSDLADANDCPRTFKQIAAAIEADPTNFFTEGSA